MGKKNKLVMGLLVTVFTFIWLLVATGCESKQTESPVFSTETTVSQGPIIDPSEVEWITKTGGPGPSNKWKVLVPQKDTDTIEKITRLINTTIKTEYISNNYGHGKAIGYPVNIEIKLKSGDLLRISPLYNVTTRKVENGIESSATAYRDRVLITIEGHTTKCQYDLMSGELAEYLFNGSNQDIPRI